MTPSSTPLRRASKKRLANTEIPTRLVELYVRPSKWAIATHTTVVGASLLVPLNLQIPLEILVASWLWVLACVIHRIKNPQPWHLITDEGTSWLLTAPGYSHRVRFVRPLYCSPFLLVLAFNSQSHRRITVCIWADAVSPAAFSWLSARAQFSAPDKAVKSMATSELIRRF